VRQIDPTCVGNFSNTESGNSQSYFPIHQPFFDPVSNLAFSTNYLEGVLWPTQDDALGVSEEVLDPQLQM